MDTANLTPEQLAAIAAIVNTPPPDAAPVESSQEPLSAGSLVHLPEAPAPAIEAAPALTADQVEGVEDTLTAFLNAANAAIGHVIDVLRGALAPPPQLSPDEAAAPQAVVSDQATQAAPSEPA